MFGEATEGYGAKPVLAVGLIYFLCKGLSNSLFNGSLIAMFLSRFGVEGLIFQRYANLVSMGWSVKPLTAVVSDILSFFGYTKRWYMFAACVVGPVFSLAFGLLPAKTSSAAIGSVFVFFFSFCQANVDILSEGHYSRMMRRVPAAGPALVSWVWWFIASGVFIASFIVGPLGDAKIPQISPLISCAVQLMALPLFLLNWLGELPNREERYNDACLLHTHGEDEKKESCNPPDGEGHRETSPHDNSKQPPTTNQPNMLAHDLGEGRESGELPKMLAFKEPRGCFCGVFHINEEVFHRNRRATMYSVIIACCVIAVATTSIVGSRLHLLIVAVVVSLLHCGVNFYSLSWIIAKANLFGYVSNASTVSFPGAVTPFLLADHDCVPDGPNFSLFFLQTVGSTLSSITSIVGIVLFNYFFSKRTYRMTYFVTLVLLIVSNMIDLVIVMRWNRPYVSDHVVYLLGNVIIFPVIGMLNWMPTTILLSRLCPRGSESTVYAILAASSNLGNSMGNVIGSVVMEYALPVKTRVPCDFGNLKWLIVIAGFLSPCIQIPLIFVLLPDARMCDDIDLGILSRSKEGEKDGGKRDGEGTDNEVR
nr:folate transporter 3 [Trypanosoma congolense]